MQKLCRRNNATLNTLPFTIINQLSLSSIKELRELVYNLLCICANLIRNERLLFQSQCSQLSTSLHDRVKYKVIDLLVQLRMLDFKFHIGGS